MPSWGTMRVPTRRGPPMCCCITPSERGTGKNGLGDIRAAAVAANVNPKLLYTEMVPGDALDPAFLRRMRQWRCGSGTFRMNVALSKLPSFTALPGSAPADHHTPGIILAPSLAYMDRAYCDARLYRSE